MPDAAEVGLLMLELDNRDDFGKPSIPLMKGYSTISPNLLAKAQELLGRQRLIAEEHHAVLEPGAPNCPNRRLAQRAAEIDAENLGPDCTRDRPHLDCAFWPGLSPGLCPGLWHGRLRPLF